MNLDGIDYFRDDYKGVLFYLLFQLENVLVLSPLCRLGHILPQAGPSQSSSCVLNTKSFISQNSGQVIYIRHLVV